MYITKYHREQYEILGYTIVSQVVPKVQVDKLEYDYLQKLIDRNTVDFTNIFKTIYGRYTEQSKYIKNVFQELYPGKEIKPFYSEGYYVPQNFVMSDFYCKLNTSVRIQGLISYSDNDSALLVNPGSHMQALTNIDNMIQIPLLKGDLFLWNPLLRIINLYNPREVRVFDYISYA